MAHGIPDFYRGVDIAYQALAQLLVRPTYGGADGTWAGVSVNASEFKTLVTVSGQGMLYGGYIFVDHTSSHKADSPMLLVDGNDIADESWETLSNYYINDTRGFPFAITRFDDANFIYSLLLQYGITFETSLQLKYLEASADPLTVYYSLVYALV